MSEPNLDDLVVTLTRERTFNLPMHMRLNNHQSGSFVVIGDNFYVTDFYGGVTGYDLDTLEEIFYIERSSNNKVKALATDGERLYAHIEGGAYNVAPEDILIGKVLEWNEIDLPEDEIDNTDPNAPRTYKKGFVSFLGKTARELYANNPALLYPNVDAGKQGIKGRIVSFPTHTKNPLFVFNPEWYTDGRARVLIHAGLAGPQFLSSGNGHVEFMYNYHSGEGGCETSAVITSDGQVIEGRTFRERNPPIAPSDLLARLSFHPSSSSRQFTAEIYVPPTDEDDDEDDRSHSVPIFAPDLKPMRWGDIGNLTCYAKQGDKLHVLYNHTQLRTDREWTFDVPQPAQLVTYDIAVDKRSDIDKPF